MSDPAEHDEVRLDEVVAEEEEEEEEEKGRDDHDGEGADVGEVRRGTWQAKGGEDSFRIKVGPQGREGLLSAAMDLSFNAEEYEDDEDSTYLGDLQEQKERARMIVKKFYPTQVQPTMLDFVMCILEQDDGPWRRGSWVEYMGNDMKWHVAQVKRVIQQAPDSWDWNDPDNENKEPDWLYFYNVGKATLLPARSIRATEIGLKKLFGSRPWVWQQYALLKFEKFVRFQKDHERDFEEVDCQKWADDIFVSWIEDPRNEDFKMLFESYPDETQDLLRDHLVTPFVMMDQIVENEEEWDFEDADFSVYSYMSIHGSGVMFVLFCAAIQAVIPVVLLLNALESSPRFDASFSFDDWHVDGDWDTFCTGDGSSLGKVMNIAVVLIYMLTVLPSMASRLYRTTGDYESTYSRMNSLREVVWEQRDDTLLQAIGYKTDRYLNTAYVSFLYVVILFILFNTDEVLDIILNALAADFVHHIDEEIAGEEWFDPGQRLLKAGAVQLVIQANLQLRVLESPKAFCRKFDVPIKSYNAAVGTTFITNRSRGLKDLMLGLKDDNDNRFKSAEDSQFFLCADYAAKKGNTEAFKQFKKTLVTFSLLDRLQNKLRINKIGIFHKYMAYRTWSRWDKLLFLSEVPPVFDEQASHVFRQIELSQVVYNTEPHTMQLFIDIFRILSGLQMIDDIGGIIRKGLFSRLPFQVIDSILQIIVYLIQLLFPFLVFGALWFMPFCY